MLIQLIIIIILAILLLPRFIKITAWLRVPLWIIISVLILLLSLWHEAVNYIIPYNIRTEKIPFAVREYSDVEFNRLVTELEEKFSVSTTENKFSHIEAFRKAEINSFQGPATCVSCHDSIEVKLQDDSIEKRDLRQDLTHSVHFTFRPMNTTNSFGFNGKRMDNFPLGKIDLACAVNGSFLWTAWAVQVENSHGDTLSKGCGKCHIVGQYGPILSAMLPRYEATEAEWEATDCLVCHAAEYDINRRKVVRDPNGKTRWNHDRRMIAAMSVTSPETEYCERCHKQNYCGETYREDKPIYNLEDIAAEFSREEVQYDTLLGKDIDFPSPVIIEQSHDTLVIREDDVHSSFGIGCLDCHVAQGHRIPRGRSGVDLLANDLPQVEVSCVKCHGREAHGEGEYAEYYNHHAERIACETCHIRTLREKSLKYRDWTQPVFVKGEGIYIPYSEFTDDFDQAVVYRWFNGYGLPRARAFGDNPNRAGSYYPVSIIANKYWDRKDAFFNIRGYYNDVLRPTAREDWSKITPFKSFQAKIFQDQNNQGPFGGMILPVDYRIYFQEGDCKKATLATMSNQIMKTMYSPLMKFTLMNRFMAYMKIDGWRINFDSDRIVAMTMRNEANLMINHGVSRSGPACNECHTAESGILDFNALGYTEEEIERLTTILD